VKLGQWRKRLTLSNVNSWIPDKASGIYLFYDDQRCVYVGKANVLRSRISQHLMGHVLSFPSFHWDMSNFSRHLWAALDIPRPSCKENKDLICTQQEFHPHRIACEILNEAMMACLSFRFVECDPDDTKKREKAAIKKYYPSYNGKCCRFRTWRDEDNDKLVDSAGTV
jgi:hypothetical protein